LVDGAAPSVSSAEIVSGNTYIDIVFSEGVYGAGDGAAALTAEKFALTFTQNSGSATGVTISSVKKMTTFPKLQPQPSREEKQPCVFS
jgi:hypothetical protein